ncbi:MAG TPA: phage tail protein [Methanosarcina sp.]|nr:phage tail protein [Methanosarcina sp.]
MQESKYKRINTKSLFEEFKTGLENLELTEEGLRLTLRELYKPGDDILNEPDMEMRDVDTDECDIVYILDRRSASIIPCHRDFEKLRFPAYGSGALASVFENPEGIAVDENSVYVIGTLRAPDGEKKEALVAFRKKDLEILWTVLEGPDRLALKDITDLDMDYAGNLYVLEKGRQRVLKLSLSSRERVFSEIGRVELQEPENIYIDKEGTLQIFDSKAGYFVFGTDGTAEKRDITSSIQGMVSRKRTHDSKNNMYLLSETGTRLRLLQYVKEYSPDPEGVFKGMYLSKPVDSQVQETRWYRFMLGGSFPKGTTVEFHYYISDEFLDEKKLKELPESEWEEGLPGSSVAQGEKKRDALFRTERKGRYLWFRITLVGTEKLSPEVSTVTIFFPKVSYLKYLPSVYSENPANRDFLDRFLAIFESLFFEIDFTIDHLGRWFDAAGTPPEFLEWLASWVAADQGGESTARKKISEAKQREFISQAVSMYRERGTRQGLEDLIYLYIGKKPIIIENLPAGCIKRRSGYENRKENERHESQKGDNSKNESPKKNRNPEQKKFLFFPPEEARVKLPDGKGTGRREVPLHDVLFGEENFSFVVLFEEKLEEAELELIKDIIEEEKPAYTIYRIKVLEPWFYLDGHTYLGKNTRLRRPEFLLGKYSVLSRDTALGVEKRPDVA